MSVLPPVLQADRLRALLAVKDHGEVADVAAGRDALCPLDGAPIGDVLVHLDVRVLSGANRNRDRAEGAVRHITLPLIELRLADIAVMRVVGAVLEAEALMTGVAGERKEIKLLAVRLGAVETELGELHMYRGFEEREDGW